jgi:hypothetical protein
VRRASTAGASAPAPRRNAASQEAQGAALARLAPEVWRWDADARELVYAGDPINTAGLRVSLAYLSTCRWCVTRATGDQLAGKGMRVRWFRSPGAAVQAARLAGWVR